MAFFISHKIPKSLTYTARPRSHDQWTNEKIFIGLIFGQILNPTS